MLLFERADRAERKDSFHAERFKTVNVGAKIQLGGRQPVPASVTRQEGDFFSRELSYDIVVRGFAPGTVERDFFVGGEAGHGIQTAAANDADGWFHSCISSSRTPPVEEGCTKT